MDANAPPWQGDSLVALWSMAPESFLGKWEDSYGNAVCVYSTDAFETHPMATLSRAPRPDIHLKLVPREDGWHCGHAILDVARCSETQVCWVFPNGHVSLWTRWPDDAQVEDSFGSLELQSKGFPLAMLPQMWVPIGMVRLG
mmetsp:Transcript_83763/g.260143  ORF Transcript_83763/g.260143 Transcript_83763/m.260143 type:complete len:142 (+) Transcript_83763:565-990(+)